MKKSITERFWSKVDVRGEDDCWEWEGGKNKDGYGRFNVNGRIFNAHVVAYSLTFGEVIEGKCICHFCDNRPCCNPKHLWQGTHLQNMEDMARKKRAWGTRLSEADVIRMRELYTEGRSLTEIGFLFGVGFQHVSRIVNRKAWKFVP